MPMVYVKAYGNGRVSYLANGHTLQAWKHPEFRKMLLRAVAWSAGASCRRKSFAAACSGMVRRSIWAKGMPVGSTTRPGMQTVAMCDASPARVEAAKQEVPELQGYFTDVDEMLAMPDLDLVVNHSSRTISMRR